MTLVPRLSLPLCTEMPLSLLGPYIVSGFLIGLALEELSQNSSHTWNNSATAKLLSSTSNADRRQPSHQEKLVLPVAYGSQSRVEDGVAQVAFCPIGARVQLVWSRTSDFNLL